MTEFIAIAALAAGLGLLVALAIIDYRTMLLPDKLVAPLAALGLVFHYVSHFYFMPPEQMAAGALAGGGLLYAVRLAANAYYKDDALGLGDVKLMAAAGVWLGLQDVILALIIGAAAGVFHGLNIAVSRALKTKTKIDLKTLSLPAGPGFIFGIIVAAVLKFWSLPAILLP